MRRIELAGWALIVTQVVHGLTPADTESEGYVGAVVGLVLLVASMAGVYALRTGRRWGSPVVGWTGAAVAIGFVAYHATPLHSPVTNPYVGESVGAPAWISVAICVAVGAWAFVEDRRTAAVVGS